MATEPDFVDKLLKPIKATIAAREMVNQAIAPIGRDGTIPALARDGIKDLRSTIHEVFFGCSDGIGEPGAPLNPTQGEIAAGRHHSESHAPPEKGKEPAPAKGWVDRLLEERAGEGNAGSDGYQRGRERSLPAEQKEQERERERGGRER